MGLARAPHSSGSCTKRLPPPPTRPAPRPGSAPRGPAPSGGTDWSRPPSLPRAIPGIGRLSHARHTLSSGPWASLPARRAGPGGEWGRAGDRSSGGVRHRFRPRRARAARAQPDPARPASFALPRLAASSPHGPAPAAPLQDQPTEGFCVLRTT
jgi:hypothetical protein